MKQINKIIDVSYPNTKINGSKYLIGRNGKYEIRNFIDDEILLSTNLNECNFSIVNEKVFFTSQYSVFVYDLSSNELFLFYKSDKEVWFFNEEFIFHTQRTEVRREYEYSCVEISNNETLWMERSMQRPSTVSNKELFFTDILGSTFCKKEIDSGSIKWSIDFSENRISGKVLFFNEILVFTTANQDLIGIDNETGKELWKLSNCNLHHQKQPNTNYLVGLSSNSFGDNFYQVIDPIRGKKVIDKKFDNFFFETNPNLACITETHYYFISNILGDGTGTKSERVSHLGSINLKNHELEWIEKIDKSTYQNLEVQNNKFYLLDVEQNLKIFEKV